MKRLFATMQIIISISTTAQTVVIAYKTKDAVYVGADSRFTLTRVTPFGFSEVDTTSICKIYNVGNYNFAVVGYEAIKNIEIAKKACLNQVNKNIEDVANEYLSLFQNHIIDVLQTLFSINKDRFNEHANKGYGLSNIYFFGMGLDSLYIYRLKFSITDVTTDSFSVTSKAESAYSLIPLASGHVKEIGDTLKHKSIWKNGIANTINFLIKKQSVLYPIEVGGAIDIIKVTKSGVSWLQRKKMCN